MFKYRFVIGFIATFASLCQAQDASLFDYKKPAPPQPESSSSSGDFVSRTELNQIVLDLISKSNEASKLDTEKDAPVDIGGKLYLILKKEQTYLGKINGSHVVFDQSVREYTYHPFSTVDKVIRQESLDVMKNDAASELEKLRSSLLDTGNELTPISSKPQEIPRQNTPASPERNKPGKPAVNLGQ